jgi:predicted lipid-binding transport protein (Tim44 family)
MNESLRDRITRHLEPLSDERGYQVLDYIEFLESKYATAATPAPSLFQRFTEGVEDTLRAGKVSTTAIAETMGLLTKAVGVLNDVTAAGKSVASDIATAGKNVASGVAAAATKAAEAASAAATAAAAPPPQPPAAQPQTAPTPPAAAPPPPSPQQGNAPAPDSGFAPDGG